MTTPTKTTAHCMCDACKTGVIHASDCAVHNMPAYPNGPCDCEVLTPITAKVRAIAREAAERLDNCGDNIAVANNNATILRTIRDAFVAAVVKEALESCYTDCPCDCDLPIQSYDYAKVKSALAAINELEKTL